MKERLLFLFKYFIFWVLFSEVFRLIFIIYNYNFINKIPIPEILKSFIFGLKLDISVAGYLILLISIISALTFYSNKFFLIITRIITVIFIFFFSIISVIDMELYSHWGFRIDATILLYLKTPKESLASTPLTKLILLIIFVFLITYTVYLVFNKIVIGKTSYNKHGKWYSSLVYLIVAGLMIIPVRGGLGLAPVNQGSVYFSEKHQFANHTAVNPVWNFGDSILNIDKKESVNFMPDKEVKNIFDNLLKHNKKSDFVKLIKVDNPNIIIILLESFTANVIEPLGGVKNATPNINRLSHEGVFFTNIYASGDRSDKGIVAVLSGYPAQPTTSIIKYVRKTEHLPYLSKDLKEIGYNNAFYYGGDIDFANMKSYFINGSFEHMITLKDFHNKDLNSKWGAHDHVVFNRFIKDLNHAKMPFFRVLFTLSSHEPYDVPHKSEFSGNSEEQMFLNSVHYSDSCVGDFIKKAKQSEWWKNTLIILIADHGKNIPGNVPYNSPRKFKIPMLWLGGAILKDTIIDATASQSDLPLMIEHQIGKEPRHFIFSKDVLNNGNHFAFYAYNNGFGFYNDTTGFVWDNNSQKIIFNHSAPKPVVRQGKAFFQILLDDFNTK